MNKLKSIFVGTAPMLGMAAIVVAVRAILAGGPPLAWAGVVISNAAFPVFLAWLMLASVARTSAGLPVVVVVALGGTVLAATGAGDAGVAPVAWALAGLAVSALYVLWYSRLGRPTTGPLVVGAPLPDFTVETEAGDPVASAALRGKPSVILFFRGNWCPLCMAQIREIAGLYRRIEEMGAEVVLISPQSHEKTRALADRFDAPMRFLVDRDNTAAVALGLAQPDGLPLGMQVLGYDSDTVMPTMVVTDAEGTVLALDQTDNYRVRPEPSVFIDALTAAGVGT